MHINSPFVLHIFVDNLSISNQLDQCVFLSNRISGEPALIKPSHEGHGEETEEGTSHATLDCAVVIINGDVTLKIFKLIFLQERKKRNLQIEGNIY